jgi:double-stranded uracil-DNA glycosylase
MPAARTAVPLSRGFPPVIGHAPRILLLGSLPGRASIAAGEYYAQRQNAFWRIVGALCGAGPGLDYAARLAALKHAGIALWDVLAAAEREGSLDADIVRSSHEVNDIIGLLRRYRGIRLVAFNGQTAAAIFRRHIEPDLPRAAIELEVLPSTSPAYASLSPEQKLRRWRTALVPHLRAG